MTEHERVIRNLVRRGFCSRCRKKREVEQAKARRCLKCSDYHRQYNSQVERDEILNFALPYAGHRPCAVCRDKFFSTNKRSVTRCDGCRYKQFLAADQCGYGDFIYE